MSSSVFDEILDWDLAPLQTGVDAFAKRAAGIDEYCGIVRNAPALQNWTGAASEAARALAGRHASHSGRIAGQAHALLGPLSDYLTGGGDLKGQARQLADEAASHGYRIGPDGSVLDGPAPPRASLYSQSVKQRFAGRARSLLDQDARLHQDLADAIKAHSAAATVGRASTSADPTALQDVRVGEAGAVDPSLHLDGAANARDIGGYETADGRTVRTGLVLRSNRLEDLTDSDVAKLRALGLSEVDDLRTPGEQAQAPDRIIPGVQYKSDPVFPDSYNSRDMTQLYTDFVAQPQERQAFASVLRDVEAAPGPIMYHCSSGKDRTGWTTAVLLTILGVPQGTVEQDYLLSNQYLHEAPAPGSRAGVDVAWLRASFAQADQEFGGMDGYVRQGLGLSDADVQAIRAKLLVS